MLVGRRPLASRLVGLVGLGAAACSLVTDVPDLTGGADAAAGADAACPPHVFTYDPKGRSLRSVHVAGSFNGWPQTIAAGGWPLAKSGAIWTATHALPRGKSAYKLVLDEAEWIPDPSNATQEPDGFGGMNSVLYSDCGG